MSLEETAKKYAARNKLDHEEAAEKPVMGMLLGDNPEYRDSIPDVSRAVSAAVRWANDASEEELEEATVEKRETEDKREGLPELPPVPWDQRPGWCFVCGSEVVFNENEVDYVTASCHTCGNHIKARVVADMI